MKTCKFVMDTQLKKREIDLTFLHKQLKKHEAKLRKALLELDKCNFIFLRVLSCNASYPISFTDASCITEPLKTFAPLSDFFSTSVLKHFLDNGVLPNDDDKVIRLQEEALLKLAAFMDGYEEKKTLINQMLEMSLTVAEWNAVFSVHLIERLSIARGPVIISDVGYSKNILSRCPCGCKQELYYGDTSMGNRKVWHGSTDMISGCSAIIQTTDTSTKPETEEESPSAFEMEATELTRQKKQLIPQSIVLSCISESSPLIATSMDELQFYIYNLNSDVLVRSGFFPIRTPKLKLYTVLALWMALNDRALGTIPEYCTDDPDFCSNFKSLITAENTIDIYENELHFFACKKKASQNEKRETLQDISDPEMKRAPLLCLKRKGPFKSGNRQNEM